MPHVDTESRHPDRRALRTRPLPLHPVPLAATERASTTSIAAFLAGRRIAFVGVSTRAEDFSRVVFRALAEHGYDLVPVHPGVAEIEGHTAFARVRDIPGHLDGALVMTAPAITDDVVRDCAAAGVPRIWLHRGVGPGSVTANAIAICHAHGIDVVAGECPLMFLSGPWFHRAHAAIRRAEGRYPAPVAATRARRPAADRAALVVGHGALAWLACAAIMGGLLAITSTGVALAVHLVATPLVFAAVAALYVRVRGDASPLAAAAVFTATAVVLDAVVVAGVIDRSPAMFASITGTWLPLALGFAAAVVTGVRARRRGAARPLVLDGPVTSS